MTSIYIIITVLGATALAKGTMECNLTQPTKDQQCFGSLGEPLFFHLPTKPTIKISIKRDNDIVFKYPCDECLEIHAKYREFSTSLKNGTFLVKKITKEYYGDYQLELHSSANGERLQKIDFLLKILAAVSEPAVSQTCLSAEQMTVSCSAEGDEAEFTLSLDNNELIRTRAGRKNNLTASNVTISLYGQLVGNLVCHVQNHVSRQQTVIHLTSCIGASSHFCPPTVAAAVIATMISLLLCLAVFLLIKHFNKKASNTTVRQGDSQDEIVYSAIRVTHAAR